MSNAVAGGARGNFSRRKANILGRLEQSAQFPPIAGCGRLALSTRRTWKLLALSGSQTTPFLRAVNTLVNLDVSTANGSVRPEASEEGGLFVGMPVTDADAVCAGVGELIVGAEAGAVGVALGAEDGVSGFRPATNISGAC